MMVIIMISMMVMVMSTMMMMMMSNDDDDIPAFIRYYYTSMYPPHSFILQIHYSSIIFTIIVSVLCFHSLYHIIFCYSQSLSLSHSIAPTIDSSSEINFYILQTSLPYYILDSIRYSSVEKTNCHIHHLFHMPSMSIRDSSSQAYDRSSLLFAGLGVWDLTADKK